MHLTRRFAVACLLGACAVPRLARAVVASGTVVRVAHTNEPPDGIWVPTPDGLKGANPTILRLVAKEAGFDVAFQALPWLRAQSMVKSGELDALMTIPNAERSEYCLFTTEPVAIYKLALVYSKSNANLAALGAASMIGDLKNFLYLYNDKDDNSTKRAPLFAKSDASPSNESMLKKIAASRGDFTLLSMVRAKYLAKTLGIADSLEIRAFGSETVTHHFGLRRGFPNAEEIVAAVDAVSAKFRVDGRMDQAIENSV
jgi:polar amino acid transport system substrate-binding protein